MKTQPKPEPLRAEAERKRREVLLLKACLHWVRIGIRPSSPTGLQELYAARERAWMAAYRYFRACAETDRISTRAAKARGK